MNILITGKTGLAQALYLNLSQNHSVTCVSRSTGHDIGQVENWVQDFLGFDSCINCAYDGWSQVTVLEQFFNAWHADPTKQIINIGSSLVDYTRIELEKEHEYMSYRVHKQALQSAFHKLVKLAQCDIKLINPGAIDTARIQHLSFDKKMSPNFVAEKIVDIMKHPSIKKVDLWQ